MQIYAVFLPSGMKPQRAAEQAKLVCQGFDWGAFLLTPLWAMRHGLWLALTLWACWIILSGAIASLGHLDPGGSLAVYELGALAFGLEADRFKQAKLSRAGFHLNGLSLGDSVQDAESLYFNRRSDLLDRPTDRIVANAPGAGPRTPAPNEGSDLLGLFPPPEYRN
jgi:hypothetical protein